MGYTVYKAFDYLFSIMEILIIARIIISWIPIPKENRLIQILYQITEPILAPVRHLIEKSAIGHNIMMDFSPIIVFIIIRVIKTLLANLLIR